MRISIKHVVLTCFCSLSSLLFCDEVQSKEAKVETNRVSTETEKQSLTLNAALKQAWHEISEFGDKNSSFEFEDTLELEKLMERRYELDEQYKKAMYAHPELADLVEAAGEPRIAPAETVVRLEKLKQAAIKIPELRAMKDHANAASLAEVNLMVQLYESQGQQELAQKIRGILARVK